MHKMFQYRIFPTKQQQKALFARLEACRWLYNHLLEQRKTVYEQTGKGLSLYQQINTFPVLKQEHPDLRSVHSQVLQNVAVRVDLAFKAFCCLLIVLAMLFTACNATTPVRQTTPPRATSVSALPQVTITAKDYSFDMPETLQAGLVDVKLNNTGSQAHQAQLARLKDGVSYDQLLAALKRGPQAALPMMTLVGGPDIISAGQSQEVALKLSPGSYIALSFVTGQDNIIDVQKGMFKLFTVSQPTPTPTATGQATTGEPTADIQITLKDSTFTVPSSIKAAMLTVKVTNQGTQPHALALLKLQPGRSLRDVQHFLQYPSTVSDTPPFDYSGGMAALEPGTSAWLILNLAPGNYVAVHDLPPLQSDEAWPQTNQLMAFSVQTA